MTRFSFPVFCSKSLVALLAVLLLSPAWGLKPSHEADRLLHAAEEAMGNNNYSQAEEHLNAARQLGIGLPPEYDFFQGKLLQQRDDLVRARGHLEQYVNQTGDSGPHYREALSLITRIEKQRSGLARANTDASRGTAEIRWANDQEQYVEDIRELYQQPDASQALARHINSLLKFYAYSDERIVAASRRITPSRHQIHTTDNGEIVSRNQIGTVDNQPFTEDRFSVYGIDPYIKHRCSQSSCWLMHPVTSERWLQIVENEDVAAELAKAVTHLIKRMQKG